MFKHGFQNSLNPICNCGNNIETTAHFLLHGPHYSNKRSIFLNTIRNINRNIFDKNDLQITEPLLYGDSSLEDKSNAPISNATIDFVLIRTDLTLICFNLNMAVLYNFLVKFIVSCF